jgi:hypothetical protein
MVSWFRWWWCWWFAPLHGLTLTAEERMTLEQTSAACPHCGGYHEFACPYLLEAEYYESGAIKRVVYRPEHRRLVRYTAG